MTGDGGASVLITLDTGVEYIYATEEKTDSANTTDGNAGKVSESGSNAKTYITVTDGDGNEKAIVLTELVPRVRGVLIVCRGGEREEVAAQIRKAVATALNISEKNISVSGRG